MTDASAAKPRAGHRELRGFGFTFSGVAAVFALFLWWRGRTAGASWFLAAAVSFLFVGALVPGLLRPFHGPWMKFAEILGYINTRILLSLFYFIGITPTGLLMRIFGKDPMGRTFKHKDAPSYWTKPIRHEDGARHFDRQF